MGGAISRYDSWVKQLIRQVFLVVGMVWLAAVPAGAQGAELFTGFAPETVVATVDDEPLTLGELIIRYATLSQLQRDAYAAHRGGLTDFLTDTVGNMIVAREALELDVAADPMFEILMKIRREEVLRDLYARRTVLAPIDEETIAARYNDLREVAFQRQPMARVRHILVTPVAEEVPPNATADDAQDDASARLKVAEILRALSAGDDFADLAHRLSEDASAPDGGDLGWVGQDDLVPELSKAVFSLAAGEISTVVESELGYHLVQVVERRRGGLVPYELVRELLFQELVGERADALGRAARRDLQRLIEQYEVELFPERLPW